MMKRENYTSYCEIGANKTIYIKREGYEWKEDSGLTRKYVSTICPECYTDFKDKQGELEIIVKKLADDAKVAVD